MKRLASTYLSSPNFLFSFSFLIELVSQMGFCDIPFQFFYALLRHFNTQTSCLVFCSPFFFFLTPFLSIVFSTFSPLPCFDPFVPS